MVPHEQDEWTSVSIALVPAGGVRTPLDQGPITYADLKTTIPFENTVDVFELRGDHLLETLEFSVSKSVEGQPFNSYVMLHVAGMTNQYLR